MTSSTVDDGTTQTSKSYAYDAIGNMTFKSGMGAYNYGVGNRWPHAVTRVGGRDLGYDANGNMFRSFDFTSSNVRELRWTSYNKPREVFSNIRSLRGSRGGNRTTFSLWGRSEEIQAGRQNVAQWSTFPLTPMSETTTSGREQPTTAEHLHYVFAGRTVVAIHKVGGDGSESQRFLHRDHLDSITAVTDEMGQPLERLSYDPHGKRRHTDWSDAAGSIIAQETKLGFTGHLTLDRGRVDTHARADLRSGPGEIPVRGSPRSRAVQSAELQSLCVRVEQPAQLLSIRAVSPFPRSSRSCSVGLGKRSVEHSRGLKGRLLDLANRSVRPSLRFNRYLLDAQCGQQPRLRLSTTVLDLWFYGFASASYAAYITEISDGDDREVVMAFVTSYFTSSVSRGIERYVPNESLSRVVVESAWGGISAELHGGDFKKGAITASAISTTNFLALRMRQAMIAQSRLSPEGRLSQGMSAGWNGDGFKLGGGRFQSECRGPGTESPWRRFNTRSRKPLRCELSTRIPGGFCDRGLTRDLTIS